MPKPRTSNSARRARAKTSPGSSAPTERPKNPTRSGAELVRDWFAARGWTPHEFQLRAWEAFARGASGLIRVATGAGKTYAAYGGPLADLLDERARVGQGGLGLRVLYITPLRAVARDIELALRAPLADLGALSRSSRDRGLRVEGRTGDTGSSLRARQRERLPEVLVTTPESLSLMLTWPDARERLGGVRSVIVDEWHELLGSKRGTQTELALARLRRFNPALCVWGLSATLENLHDAARALTGANGTEPEIISASVDRPVFIDSVLPSGDARLPWAGHLGLAMLPAVLEAIDPGVSTLIFTNTRSQAERWHAAILAARPAWEPILGLHHGSVDRAMRERVEAGLKDGSVRLCVATSSLDLGVDFAPVERVIQIGSVKGIARTVQRAGRSGHRPGAACRVLCVPTHGLELLEIAAVRRAMASGESEPREALRKPLDVLAQHMVTCAIGGGYDPGDLFEEVRSAYSY
ncbi:MAG: DEAD/DEAH box helicase, partial [Planctomycetota bacterium]|nr:DEAD/DEAH box helicase [Planctomycetota bacterium]